MNVTEGTGKYFLNSNSNYKVMDDKEALLKAIEKFSEEDMPRLMMADYLDENCSSDLDTATAEFIKISCKSQNKKRQYPHEGRWIQSNWKRLVPGLHAQGFEVHKRLGRFLHLKKKYEQVLPRVRSYSVWVILEFWKGYVKKANCYRPKDVNVVYPYLFKDQPLAELGVDGLPRWARIRSTPESNSIECSAIDPSRCPDYYNNIQDHDVETTILPFYGQDYDLSVKAFLGKDHLKRAKISVSNAIRQYCLLLENN